jgi:hypothetical protein
LELIDVKGIDRVMQGQNECTIGRGGGTGAIGKTGVKRGSAEVEIVAQRQTD